MRTGVAANTTRPTPLVRLPCQDGYSRRTFITSTDSLRYSSRPEGLDTYRSFQTNWSTRAGWFRTAHSFNSSMARVSPRVMAS